MVAIARPVALEPRSGGSDWLIWGLASLAFVIAATLSASVASAAVDARSLTFGRTSASEDVAAAELPAVTIPATDPLEASATTSPLRTGTVATAAEVEFLSALAALIAAPAPATEPSPVDAATESLATAPSAAPASTPVAPPEATPAPAVQPSPVPTAIATPAATAVATPVATPPTAAAPPVAYSARAQGLFLAMNQERLAAGVPALMLLDAMSVIAMERALDMQENDYFAHVSPTEVTWLTLINDAGIPLTAGGENLAKISGDIERSVTVAITKLMESPSHAANIVSEHYDSVGVAAVTDDRNVTIFVTIFIGN
jgi:uncharacterized protein YkwD